MTVPGLAGQYAEMPHEYPHNQGGGGYHPEHAQGWLSFAGIMLGIIGVLNAVFGIAAISDSDVFVKSAKYLALNNLHVWGWIFVGLGLIQVSAAVSIWRRGMYGAIVGIITAAMNMFGTLFTLRAYPFWSLAVLALDVLVIYGLAVYGGRGSRTTTA
jgi:hypothetical protein